MKLLQPLSIAAAGIAAAQAFLVVPEIENVDPQAFTVKGPVPSEVDLPCPGCPLRIEKSDGEIKIKTDKKSHLELNFAIDDQGEQDRLLLNNFEIFPVQDILIQSQPLTAPHKPDHYNRKHHHEEEKQDADEHGEELKEKRHEGHHKHKFLPATLGFRLDATSLANDGELELIDLTLQIIEVGNTFVDGIPTVQIRMIKTSSGKLILGSIDIVESQPEEAECAGVWCRIAAMAKEQAKKWKGFKQCHGKANVVEFDSADTEGKKHHHHHHHGWGRHGHKHSWGQLIKSIASHILLPILIGIIAGVSVSLIGMMVGTCIVALWRTFFRRSRRAGHAHHRAVQKETAVAEEKSGLMAHQDPPPSYEEEDISKSES